MSSFLFRWIVFSLPLLLGASSCLSIGDSVARLRGRVVLNGDAASNCELSLHLASTDQLVEAIKVPAEFEETFVIAPGEDDYYATISCQGIRDEYRSENMRLGSLRTYEDGTDLGTVSISSPKPSDGGFQP